MVAENGIFVKIDDYVTQAKSIFSDDKGIYLLDFETVKCPECNGDYPAYEKTCPYTEIHPKKDDHNDNE